MPLCKACSMHEASELGGSMCSPCFDNYVLWLNRRPVHVQNAANGYRCRCKECTDKRTEYGESDESPVRTPAFDVWD